MAGKRQPTTIAPSVSKRLKLFAISNDQKPHEVLDRAITEYIDLAEKHNATQTPG